MIGRVAVNTKRRRKSLHDKLNGHRPAAKARSILALAAPRRRIPAPKPEANALIASEVRYRRLFETAEDGILILNAETGMIEDVNPSLIDLLGFTKGQLTGMRVWELGFLRNVIANREKFVELHQNKYVRYDDLPMETADGRRIDVEFVSNVSLVNGRKVIQCNVRNITERKRAEGALKLSDFSVNNASLPSYWIARDGRILRVNRAACEQLGYSEAELLALAVPDLAPGLPSENWAAHWQRLREEKRISFETTQRRKDGSIFPVEVDLNWIEFEGREYDFAFVRDISKRKQAEEELRRSEDRFRAIFDQAGIGIALVQITDGAITRCNRALADMMGYSMEELNRMRVEDISQADDYLEDLERWNNLVAGKTARFQMVKRYRRKDGQRIWGLLTCSVVRDPDGRPMFLIGMVEDITARELAKAALQSSEKRFKAVFEQAGVGIVQAEAATGRLVQVNQHFCEIVGRSREELEQITFAAISHPQEIGRDLETEQQLKTGAIREFTREKRLLRKDGSEVWATVTVSAMWQPGEVADYFIAVVQDITERKRLEDQVGHSQKMEAVGTLAAGIAHDFNNILAAIFGYTELSLLTLKDNAEVREYLGGLLGAANRAKNLVRQILTFSRQHPQDLQPIRLQPLVAECVALLRATVPSAIEFETSLGPDAPMVLADATQIHQVLMNLGTNAWQAMKDGPGRLQIKLEARHVDEALVAAQPRLRPGAYACLSVSDTGCGMDQATQRRIFEPFFTTKPAGEGTGLGLAVVHSIMASHEGAITVHSRPGEGTVFDLYFPAYAGGAALPATDRELTPRGHGERILLVDDEEPLVRLGQKTLAALGYEVATATQPEAALALVRADPQRFSLVVTDQTMPRMSGLELASQLRRIRPCLPIILTTGYSLSLTPERLEAAGIRHLLLKPSTIPALATAVHDVLSAQLSG